KKNRAGSPHSRCHRRSPAAIASTTISAHREPRPGASATPARATGSTRAFYRSARTRDKRRARFAPSRATRLGCAGHARTLDLGELAARVRHLLESLFAWWSMLGVLLAAAVYAVRAMDPGVRARDALLLVASLGALAVLASPPVAALWIAGALLFY